MTQPTEQTEWRRAACSGGQCVEVSKVADRFLIRDSKMPDGATLSFNADEWHAFVEAIKKDEFRFE
jgi:hypothetical protein